MEYEARLNVPIIAAGDIFDTTRPSSQLLYDLRYAIKNMLGGYLVNGNHDKVQPSWLETISERWCSLDDHKRSGTLYADKLIDTETYGMTQELPGWAGTPNYWGVYGINHVETRERLQEKLDQMKPDSSEHCKHLLVLHQGIEGLIPKMSAELSDGMIPDWVDMVLCGHTHMGRVMTIKTKDGKSIPLVSPGSLHLCSIDEDPRKKVYFLGVDGSIWSVPLILRRRINAGFCGSTESEIRGEVVKIVASLKKKTKERPDEIKTPIIRVVYDGSTAPKVRAIFEMALREAAVDAHVFYTNRAEKVANDLQTVVDDGIDSSFVTSGFDFAKAAFQSLEKDKSVRRIVESMLESQATQENYFELKQEFIRKSAD
jgi:DNA repair exonuclease SbcCD nuclease subunit